MELPIRDGHLAREDERHRTREEPERDGDASGDLEDAADADLRDERHGSPAGNAAVPTEDLHGAGLEEEEAGNEPQKEEGVIAVTAFSEHFRAHTLSTFGGASNRQPNEVFFVPRAQVLSFAGRARGTQGRAMRPRRSLALLVLFLIGSASASTACTWDVEAEPGESCNPEAWLGPHAVCPEGYVCNDKENWTCTLREP
jgi:hypothetical protein